MYTVGELKALIDDGILDGDLTEDSPVFLATRWAFKYTVSAAFAVTTQGINEAQAEVDAKEDDERIPDAAPIDPDAPDHEDAGLWLCEGYQDGYLGEAVSVAIEWMAPGTR
jgi:hypothetical protein